MANQLDLNEAEMAEYEEVVNELAQQLEDMTNERDVLVIHTANLVNERNEKDNIMKLANKQWEEEKIEITSRLQELEIIAAITNKVLPIYYFIFNILKC